MTAGSVILTIVETIKNNNQIREMAKFSCLIERLGANKTVEEIDSSKLVPGDVVKVPEGRSLPCDMILLSGSAIVNEAMLTGESIPVMKNCIPYMSN